MEKEIKKIQESIEVIAKTTASILENMATKKGLEDFKLETNIHFNNLEVDLKSFKNETEDSVKKIKEDVVDLLDTNMLHDKRIEKLENKFV